MPTVTEPAFLGERRRQALALAAQLDLPAKTDETWRRTSLEGLDVDGYRPSPVKVSLKGNAPSGVIFTDILTAAAEHPELVAKYLGSLYDMGQHKLSANQAALLSGGAFLYVPKNTEVTEPLLVDYECKPGEAYYLHTLVVVETSSSVTILERYEGEGDYLHVGVAEVLPQSNARVRFGYLQNHSVDAWSFNFRRGRTGRDSGLDWVGGEFGSGLIRSELVTDVNGEGSESNVRVVYGATGTQHMDILASEVSTGSNTFSDILGRGVLAGKAHTIFRGNGQIDSNAINCSTYQKQQALVLSDKARADSIPALIIEEFEVAGAGHASTVGKLDEDQLFYLMARGLNREEATTMMVLAFLAPVLDMIPVEELREEMTRLMGEKVN